MKSLCISDLKITALVFVGTNMCSISPFASPAPCTSQVNVPHDEEKPIPFGMRIELSLHGSEPPQWVASSANSLFANTTEAVPFLVVDRGNGQVAFQGNGGFISVDPAGVVSLRRGVAGTKESFQWIRMAGTALELISLGSHHYLRVDRSTGALWANTSDPQTDISNTIEFDWRVFPNDLNQKQPFERER